MLLPRLNIGILRYKSSQNFSHSIIRHSTKPWQWPSKKGLYDPAFEKEGCGVGMVVSLDGQASSEIIRYALRLSLSMKHRGAMSYDNKSGDGAGVLTSIPHELYVAQLKDSQGIQLPSLGKYATGIIFMNQSRSKECEEKFAQLAEELSLSIFAWKTVLTDSAIIGEIAKYSEPLMRQVFIVPNEDVPEEEYDLRFYILRKRASHTISSPEHRFYICSLSNKTVVYKGHLSSDQLWIYFPELLDHNYNTYMALVHNRFSTNTFPSWERAHPQRMIVHNGEINTLRGNINYMVAREGNTESDLLGEQLSKLYPIVEPNLSDSGCLDCVLEFLLHAGNRSLPEAVMTMIPEAWHYDQTMSEEKRTFYKWSACAMEPWDGPSLIAFTDGRYIGAVQDRNGLRPSRFYVTRNNILLMASEIDMYDIEDPANIILKSRLKPGRMLLVDMKHKAIIEDKKLKYRIVTSQPYGKWLKNQLITMNDLKKAHLQAGHSLEYNLAISGWTDKRLALFGFQMEAFRTYFLSMFTSKKDVQGSMGCDIPLPCFTKFRESLYQYFKQLFAQVTNPAIDSIREKMFMSLECPIGPAQNFLITSEKQANRLWLEQPILSLPDLNVIKMTKYRNWSTFVIDTTYNVSEGKEGLKTHLDKICKEAEQASSTYQFIVLSDRHVGTDWVPVSSLLALGAVHHHLISVRTRMKVALIVETGEALTVHDMCVLLGYGADAICPYLPLEAGVELTKIGILDSSMTEHEIYENYSGSLQDGIIKVLARSGISTLQSYKSAQIFEAVGIAEDVIERCFKGTPSRIGGLTMDMIASEMFDHHKHVYQFTPDAQVVLKDHGVYHYRAGGEKHVNNPESIAKLQEAAKLKSIEAYKKFRELSMESARRCLIRGQFTLKTVDQHLQIGEIESASDIMKRLSIGAMSYGSLSIDAHETLAIAMNRISAKSNSGEGGEDAERYMDATRRSAIKQIGSARWGVTSSYLAHADDIQIKIGQGAKPGEGEELDAVKVTASIAKLRRCLPNIDLISPGPHHDIYSIEDLAELIYELKCANPEAKISVKLVSAAGVGVIAAGVAKCKAEHIVICGHDGGTGASSWTAIRNTGLPWELGVAEVHQVLTMNHLRSRVTLQADGQIRTGFDVIVAAILGADEVALGTAPLIALGCVMARKCHLNTCPVGIATQDPELRRKFRGKPHHIINYMHMLADDVRYHMASLGVTNFYELLGRTDLLIRNPSDDCKTKSLNLDAFYHQDIDDAPDVVIAPEEGDYLEDRLESKLIDLSRDVLDEKAKSVNIDMNISNRCRAFGSTLSYFISKKYSEAGLPDDYTILVTLNGSAGQAFGAYLAKGVTFMLEGDANDYVGKGLSGGTIVIFPPKEAAFESHLNVIAGNVCLYGATSGKIFLRGIAGERFAVRNSGAIAVVEGVGDHACEYMTSGTVVVLGLTGRNFAAGMLGGIAYVLDVDGSFSSKCNQETVELQNVHHKSDMETIKNLLYEFIDMTGSHYGERLILDFNEKYKEFVKVVPRSVLQRIKFKSKDKENEEKEEENAKPDRLRGFMKYKREKTILRPVEERLKDMDEIYDFKPIRKKIGVECARCLDCSVPFCTSATYGCPLANVIPQLHALVYRNRWQEALQMLHQTNNFPEITGRVCTAPCETACVLNISFAPMAIKSVECAIADRGFEEGWITPIVPAVRTDKKVAIVGSGPAGLACAAQLNKAGHLVTIHERSEVPGGLLIYGVPNFKLDKKIVTRRVDLLKAEGVIFKTTAYVGKNIEPTDLVDEYDALVLCIGTTLPYDLILPGRQLRGIHQGVDFLANYYKNVGINNRCPEVEHRHVVVIGGGASAADCIATIVRLGAASVTALEIRNEPPKERSYDNPWPQYPYVDLGQPTYQAAKYKYGRETRKFNTDVVEFLDERNDGHVSKVRTIQVDWVDTDGRLKARHVEGSEEMIQADLVLIAIGSVGPERLLGNKMNLHYDSKFCLETKDFRTNLHKVFAAGDCRRGESLVMHCIADGRLAARSVDTFLIGKQSSLPITGGIIPPDPSTFDCPDKIQDNLVF